MLRHIWFPLQKYSAQQTYNHPDKPCSIREKEALHISSLVVWTYSLCFCPSVVYIPRSSSPPQNVPPSQLPFSLWACRTGLQTLAVKNAIFAFQGSCSWGLINTLSGPSYCRQDVWLSFPGFAFWLDFSSSTGCSRSRCSSWFFGLQRCMFGLDWT